MLLFIFTFLSYLNPDSPNPKRGTKLKVNFSFHIFCGNLKRFYEGLKGLHKTFLRYNKEV